MTPMSPKAVRWTALLLAALAPACGDEGPRQAPPGAPSVLLVSIDSLRPDHLSCYGYPFETSPTIDRLAREGVRFAQAVSTSSWTLPAHAALFTGLYDSGHGLVDNGLRLAEAQVTLAEVLRRYGWQTAGFFGGPYLHPTFGVSQGFDLYRSCMTAVADDLSGEAVRAESRAREGASHGDVTGPRTVEEFGRWLQTADERPFLAFVHLWDVHYDFIPPPGYAERFDPDYAGDLTGVEFMQNPRVAPDMDPRDLRHLRALYDGEIRFTDDNLALILDALEAAGRLENTIVVVTADHGEEFFEHGRKGHQHSLYEELVRIPLVFHWKGRLGTSGGAAAPVVPTTQARLVDVMPTLLALCGIDDVPTVNGRDLSPLLRGETLPAEPALTELYADGRELRALRMDTYKALQPAERHPGMGFDLVEDPREQHPLPPEHPLVRSGLKLLQRELERARQAGRGRLAQPSADIEPAVLQRLRGLGYVGGGDDREREPR
jgi:arylsulfatase A-like enzyme